MSLPALATTADVAARLGRALSPVEAARVEALLRDASAAARRAAGGQVLSAVTDDIVRVRASQRRVRLPQRPVVSISAVKLIDDITGNSAALGTPSWRWDGVDVFVAERSLVVNGPDWDSYRWTPLGLVEVTYTHGYTTIPDDVIAIVANATIRALGLQPTQAGYTTQTVDGYSFTTSGAAAAGPLGLLEEEREILKAYRRPRAPISVL